MQALHEVLEHHRLAGARQIQFASRRALGDRDQGLDRVVDVHVVAEKVPAAIHIDRLAQLGLSDQIIEGPFLGVVERFTGAVHVREAADIHGKGMQPAVDLAELLRAEFRRRIETQRLAGTPFVHGEFGCVAIDEERADEEELRLVLLARLQQCDRAGAVRSDIEIRIRENIVVVHRARTVHHEIHPGTVGRRDVFDRPHADAHPLRKAQPRLPLD